MYIPKTDGIQNIRGAKKLLKEEGYSLEFLAGKTENDEDSWAIILKAPEGIRYDIVYDSVSEAKVFVNADRLMYWVGKMTPDAEIVPLPLLQKYKEKRT